MATRGRRQRETPLAQGDSVKTARKSWAEIGFGEGYKNVVKVKESTHVELAELGLIKIGLLNGEIRSLVEGLDAGSTFEVKTPTASCGARGTGWDTFTDGKKTVVDAYEDQVFFQPIAPDGSALKETLIDTGKRAVLADPMKPLKIRDIPRARIKEWNEWKQDILKKIDFEFGAPGDPRFRKARECYEKGMDYAARGDSAFRSQLFGHAKKMYEHAEDYLLDAAFHYKRLGIEHGVDTSKEVAECDRLQRRIHVKVGKTNKNMRRRSL